MRRESVLSAVLVSIVIAGAGVSASAQQRGSGAYEVRMLGTLPGGVSAQGTSVNNIGVVSGYSTTNAAGSTMHATSWVWGSPLDLGTLGGPNSAIAWPNHDDHGRFAGIAETAEIDPLGEAWSCALAVFPGNPDGHVCLAFFWKDGLMRKLPTLGGVNGFGASINNLGQVVGWAETDVHDSTCIAPQVLQFEAVLWQPEAGVQHELTPLPGNPDGAATAINDLGQVVGISGICSNAVGGDSARYAVLWDQQGRPQDIGNLGGVAWNTPMAINNRGDIVGFSDLPGDSAANPNFHAFFRPGRGHIIDLGTLYSQQFSEALGINDEDEIVGVSFDAGFSSPHAFLWKDGQMLDLNTLVHSSAVNLISAQDINDRGEISGVAVDTANGTSPAFLAVPRR